MTIPANFGKNSGASKERTRGRTEEDGRHVTASSCMNFASNDSGRGERGAEGAAADATSRRVAATMLSALNATKYASALCRLGESRSGRMESLQKAVSVTIIIARRSLRPSEGASKAARDDEEDGADDMAAVDGMSKETLIFLAGRRRA